MKMKENGGYLAPEVKVINVSMTEAILTGSYTNIIETSEEKDEIGW